MGGILALHVPAVSAFVDNNGILLLPAGLPVALGPWPIQEMSASLPSLPAALIATLQKGPELPGRDGRRRERGGGVWTASPISLVGEERLDAF